MPVPVAGPPADVADPTPVPVAGPPADVADPTPVPVAGPPVDVAVPTPVPVAAPPPTAPVEGLYTPYPDGHEHAGHGATDGAVG